jgi:hypothetical protein
VPSVRHRKVIDGLPIPRDPPPAFMPEPTLRQHAEQWTSWRFRWSILRATFPVRPFVVALAATLLIWGIFLLSSVTLSAESQVAGIQPLCRAGTSRLKCLANVGPRLMDDGGSPGWVNVPAEYFFRRARIHGEGRPEWNPYVGSGFPVALDGHNSAFSPTHWFLTHFPGDQAHDVVAFVRFFLWTFAIVWAVALVGASTPLLAGVAAAAVLAPYGAVHVDIVFLDVDLLSPWFVLILVAFAQGRLSFRTSARLSGALGVLIGSMAFQQAQLVLCFAMGVLALAAAPRTRGRSLLLAACLGAGVLAVIPAWLPLLRNLTQFVSSRDAQCVAESGTDIGVFWERLMHPSFHHVFVPAPAPPQMATLVGTGLLLFVPRQWWFFMAALVVLGVWVLMGLPKAVCPIPLLSGLRFCRHLVPHFQMLFLFTIGIAIPVLSRRLGRKWPWIVFVAACAVAVVLANHAPLSPNQPWAVSCCFAGAGLGVLAACPHSLPGRVRRAVQRGAFELGLALFAFTPHLFASPVTMQLLQPPADASNAEALPTEVAPLPTEIDPSTPLGQVQRLSQKQDRRHYSPSGYLHPNWSAAIGVLDLLSVAALYPIGYHELNAALFADWERDPNHALNPDRFTPVPLPYAMTTEFQRVMAVHRVSLLTFDLGGAAFAAPPSPYQASKCRLLGKSQEQGTEAYLCPEVGGIGYFPGVVEVVRSRSEALDRLGRAAPSELVKTAWLGPELDLSLGASGSVDPVPGAGRVVSLRRFGDELAYVLDVERSGVFVVADTYFRGWTARVNDQPAGISRANVAFKAVRVPEGRVQLKLRFSLVLL